MRIKAGEVIDEDYEVSSGNAPPVVPPSDIQPTTTPQVPPIHRTVSELSAGSTPIYPRGTPPAQVFTPPPQQQYPSGRSLSVTTADLLLASRQWTQTGTASAWRSPDLSFLDGSQTPYRLDTPPLAQAGQPFPPIQPGTTTHVYFTSPQPAAYGGGAGPSTVAAAPHQWPNPQTGLSAMNPVTTATTRQPLEDPTTAAKSYDIPQYVTPTTKK